jgi:sulfur transfer complex TusBCD TusB component (DsrH family)
MTREAIIQKTIHALNMLPAEKAWEVADFADYVLKRHEEYLLQNGIEKLVEQSDAFQFLNNDEDIYTIEDIKEKY